MQDHHREYLQYTEALAKARNDMIERIGKDAQRRMTDVELSQSRELVRYIETHTADLKALEEKGLLTSGIVEAFEDRFQEHVGAMREISDQTKRALIDTVVTAATARPPELPPMPAPQPVREIPSPKQQPAYSSATDHMAKVMWWETTHGMRQYDRANVFEKMEASMTWPSVRDEWCRRNNLHIED